MYTNILNKNAGHPIFHERFVEILVIFTLQTK